MRELYPTRPEQTGNLNPINYKPVTQEQYDELVTMVNTYAEELQTAIGNFDQWKSDIASAFCTGTLTADNLNAITASINSVVSNTIQANKVCASNSVSASHLQSTTAYTQCLTAACRVNTNVVDANCGVITTRVDTSCIVTDDITVNNAVNYATTCTDTANITSADITCETVFNSEIQTACIYDLNSDTSQIDLATLNTACVTNLDATCGRVYKLDTTYVTHCNLYQTITDADDFYVELPKFANGTYRLAGVVNDEVAFSIEVFNSANNFLVRWSDPDYYLQDMYIYDFVNDVVPQVYIHMKNHSLLIKMYFQADTYDTITPPQSYNAWPIDITKPGAKYYEFNSRYGNWFSRNLITPTSAAEPLNILYCSDYTCSTDDPLYYDLSVEVCKVEYRPDQSVNTTDSVTFNRVAVVDCVNPDDPTDVTLAKLTAPNIYSGPALACPECCPVNTMYLDGTQVLKVSEDENNCIHTNTVATLNGLCTFCDGSLMAYDCTDNSLKPATEINIPDVITGNLTVTGNTTLCGPVVTCNGITVNGVGDFKDDVIIHKDLYVCGTEHITNTETLESSDDWITLRANNNASLGSGFSGVAINNYNGSDDLTLVTCCDGTLRVGTNSSETTNTLTDTYKYNNTLYDSTITAITTPDGYVSGFDMDEMRGSVLYNGAFYTYNNTYWYETDIVNNSLVLGSKVEDDPTITALDALTKHDLYYYRTVTYKEITVGSNQPIATRDEEVNMTNSMPVIWNTVCTRLETSTPANGCGCMILQTCINSVSGCLETEWVDNHPSAMFCHYACYCDYVNDATNVCANTIILIDECSDIVMSEDR